MLIPGGPTNHPDIRAKKQVEDGLRGYIDALLVVSHDAGFLGTIGIQRFVALGKSENF